MKTKGLVLLFWISALLSINAQSPIAMGSSATATISGKVFDQITGEEVLFATVQLQGSPMITSTDMDGRFLFSKVASGTYSLVITAVGYQKVSLTNLEVGPGSTIEKIIPVKPAVMEIEEFTIESKKVNNTEGALLAMQKNADAVQDGVSSQELGRTGAGDAGAAMKYVTGASIEENKFVVVRGLGDRYSVTSLNGITTPSSDPYRNSTSLDLIPSGMLDNIIVRKTFTPDQPGNFTGGNVDITTKSFPERFYFSFGTGISVNTQSSFQSDFLSEPGGSLDFLGMDDGTRALPDIYKDPATIALMNNNFYLKVRSLNSSAGVRDTFNQTARGLRNTFVPTEKFSPMNHAFNLAVGNVFQFNNKQESKLGYYVGANYDRSYTYYSNAVLGAYRLMDTASTELQEFFDFTDRRGQETVTLGGMASLTFRINAGNEISANAVYNQSGEQNSQISSGSAPQILSAADNDFTTMTNMYQQRSMLNLQLKGRHAGGGSGRFEVEWNAGHTLSRQDQPDMKLFAYQTSPNGTNFLDNGSFDDPFHYYRNLEDQAWQGKVDFSVRIGKNAANKIKVGGNLMHKDRNFSEQRFQISWNSGSGNYVDPTNLYYSPQVVRLDADPTREFSAFFNPLNFGIVDTLVGNQYPQGGRYIHSNFITNQSRATNAYSGYETISAVYAMLNYEWKRWKFIAGIRAEHSNMFVKSQDSTIAEGQIQKWNALPAASVVFKINDDMNLRAALSQTLARPNLRELAPFVAYDMIGAPAFNGNPDLKMTDILNLDLRYEYYFNPGEMIAFSAYGKQFTNPIVRSFNPTTGSSTGEFKFTNVPSARVGGFEVDFRSKLGSLFKSKWADNIKFGVNASLIFSEADIDSLELSSILSVNPDFGTTRPFQGQSPYLFNASLGYLPPALRMEATLSLNVFGTRLSENSQAGTPDIYEVARPMLNVTFTKWLGKDDKLALKFMVQNLTNANFRRVQSYKDQEFVVSDYQLGQTFSFSLTYQIR
ncbi:MAG: TonB-dependent receptor [Bacteroidetes bacterium]|nr:TonB-dependent receptor [Bacteroidota bacterium]